MKKIFLPISIAWILVVILLFGLSTQAQTSLPPVVIEVFPHTGVADLQIPITITGQGFTDTSQAYLGDTALLDINFVNSTTLEALVPFGLPTGIYTLTITNPEAGTLSNAYTVTEGTFGWASGGPYGGQTRDLVIHPTITNTIFVVAAQAGLFRSIDGGTSWEEVLYDPVAAGGFVEIGSTYPDVIYYGGINGLYRSEQRGASGSWSLVDFPRQGTAQPNALAISPSDADTMYCAIYNTVFFSSDGGSTWTERSTGLPGEPTHLLIDPEDSVTAYAAFEEQGVIYKTNDAGQIWSPLPFTIPMSNGSGGISSIAADPYRSGNLWLGSFNAGFYHSDDGGQTFNDVTSLITVSHQSWFSTIAFDPNQDRIYVGTIGPNDAIHFSDDAGASWQGLGLNNQGGAEIAVPAGNSDIIYTSWAGVRKSVDGGLNWTYLADGIAAIQPWHIAVSPHSANQIMVVANTDGAYHSPNSGNQWMQLDPGQADRYRSAIFDPISPTVAYLGGSGTVYKSVDSGESWQATNDMPIVDTQYSRVQSQFLTFHPISQTMLYAGVGFLYPINPIVDAGALYISSDAGDNWNHIAATGPISPVNHIVFAPGDADVIYLSTGVLDAGGFGNGIWRSDDGGQTWEHPVSELERHIVMALAVHPNDVDFLLAGVWHGSNDGDGIYISFDGGDSWEPAEGLTDAAERKVLEIVYDPIHPNIVYAATQGGLRVSFDGGIWWQPYPGPIGNIPVTTLASFDEDGQFNIYVGTVGGEITTTHRFLDSSELQSKPFMSAGVYVNRVEWHFIYLPAVLR